MKIVTGGAGFIGSAICWRLNTLGITDILIVDSDMEGTKKNNLENLKFLEFIDKDDFLKKLDNGTLDGKTDTLYHMGACSSTTEQDMDFLRRNNFEYSKTLGEWCLKNNVRYIYASSGATYGDGSLGFDDDYELIPKLKPLNKYGLSKQMFDLWVLDNKLENKFVGLKYFNVFGPNESHKGDMRSMINKSFDKVKKTGIIELFKSEKADYKDGEQKRDFIYVKDAVEMTVFFDAMNPAGKEKSGIFNVGSGEASTWNRMANAVFRALDLEPNIVYIDMPENLRKQYQYFTKANITKIRNAGYKNKMTVFEDAVSDYVRNYLMENKFLSP